VRTKFDIADFIRNTYTSTKYLEIGGKNI
jgi:hypothetical protein